MSSLHVETAAHPMPHSPPFPELEATVVEQAFFPVLRNRNPSPFVDKGLKPPLFFLVFSCRMPDLFPFLSNRFERAVRELAEAVASLPFYQNLLIPRPLPFQRVGAFLYVP